MQLLKLKGTVAFMSLRVPALILSALLIVGSLTSLAVNKLNWGLDFTGGTLIEVGFENAAELDKIRATMDAAGYGDAVIQNFGTSEDVLIRMPVIEGVKADTLGDQVLETLRSTGDQVDMRRIEFVGPNVGEELTEQGGLAMLVAFALHFGLCCCAL